MPPEGEFGDLFTDVVLVSCLCRERRSALPIFRRARDECPRSLSLESLEEYIDAQREIIERAHIDIQSLLALKREAANDPQTFVENLPDKVRTSFTSVTLD